MGKSDQFLIRRNIRAASTFPDLESAKLAATHNLNENWGAIQWWLGNGTSNKIAVQSSLPDGVSGRVYLSNSQAFVSAKGVETVVRRDSSLPGGFLIVSSYATP